MSRAERRAYKRMNKGQDPYAMPAATANRGRAAARTTRRAKPAGPFVFWSPRFMTWLVAGAILAGLLAKRDAHRPVGGSGRRRGLGRPHRRTALPAGPHGSVRELTSR